MKQSFIMKRILAAAGIILMIALLTFAVITSWRPVIQGASASENTKQELPIMTLEQVAQYDGTDPTKPIYLVYDGNVYDVTAGKEYYVPGGSYHYIAGTDATAELNMFGGEIIKKKYPIIAHVQ